jgi:hypothetical protein
VTALRPAPEAVRIDVAANVAAVRARIARAAARAGRDPRTVRLVAVSKSKPASLIEAAIAAGITDIGENYVQEAAAKRAEVRAAACWHLIGHLQRNKVGRVMSLFDVIQSVDNLELAAALSRQAADRPAPLLILVEVNLAGEATKSGVSAAALPDVLAALREFPRLAVEGLMTVPPPRPAEQVRPFFRRLRELRDAFKLRELSMGMTDDFEVAIEEGATMVRIGRAIFGARP